jgi:hypothetical protein
VLEARGEGLHPAQLSGAGEHAGRDLPEERVGVGDLLAGLVFGRGVDDLRRSGRVADLREAAGSTGGWMTIFMTGAAGIL